MELKYIKDWSEDYAYNINKGLEQKHLVVLSLARKFYETYETPLLMRSFILYVKKTDENFSSIEIIRLFGEKSPLKQVCLLAGLPEPIGCI